MDWTVEDDELKCAISNRSALRPKSYDVAVPSCSRMPSRIIAPLETRFFHLYHHVGFVFPGRSGSGAVYVWIVFAEVSAGNWN